MISQVECPTIDIDLDLPVEARYKPHRDAFCKGASDLLAEMKEDLPEEAGYLAQLIDVRTAGRFRAEAEAMASAGDVDWQDLMVAGAAYEFVLAMFGCSTIAAVTDNGPVLARNMDWWPERALARCSYEIRGIRGGVAETTVAGWPGAIGVVTGMSHNGFALAMNAVDTGEGIRESGYPVMLYLRRVMDDCKSFEEAVEKVSKQELAAPCLVTIVGTVNHERVCIERTPTEYHERWPLGDEPLLTTNHFRENHRSELSAGSDLQKTSCVRFDRMKSLLSANHSGFSDEQFLQVLSDDRVMLGITAQQIVMRPLENRMGLFVPKRLLV